MVAAISVMRLAPFFRAKGIRTVMDYGAGTLRNSKYLLKKGFVVWVVDTEEKLTQYVQGAGLPLAGQIEAALVSQYNLGVDLVLANFVINIIHGLGEKKGAAANIYRNLRPGGYHLAEIPRAAAINPQQMDDLFLPLGFQKLRVLELATSLAVLYKKPWF